MEAVGINWALALLQLVNLGLLIAWVVLAVIALRRLGGAGLGQGPTLGWAALILLVPVLGAAAFLIVRPGARA
ncbi:MAG TPA: hypothetical protein PKD53_09555 [Chloroflexaceae bacterium]|nr:hypothetical protein [Chloroflexaceae bacterium]